MLYRDTATGRIWTESELIDSLRDEIARLDDEVLLKCEVAVHGDAAIREYILEASLIDMYRRVDDDDWLWYRRISDGAVFRADQIEGLFDAAVESESERRDQITFDRWLNDLIACGAFEVLAEGGEDE